VLAKSFPSGSTANCPSPATGQPGVYNGVTYGANSAASTYGQPTVVSNFNCAPSRIDGISVTGGDAGGGIYVNGWAHNLEIANNRVFGNAGAYNGGIRVGVPYLELETLPSGRTGRGGCTRLNGEPEDTVCGLRYNNGVSIHNNAVTKNGTVEGPGIGGGAGAGISMCTGSDGYRVESNWVCGNFSQSDGGGIGHIGFSQNGRIANNQILFNQTFQQSGSTHGGGIYVGGEPPVAGSLTLGTGHVTIDSNVIRGNFAEGGHGGGIRLQQVNGAEVAMYPSNVARWHTIQVTNNMVDNNVAGWAGGGIAMADALRVRMNNNRVASNDSTGIAGVVLSGAVGTVPGTGTVGRGYPSPSGVVTETTSAPLLAVAQGAVISQPISMNNNVIWQNRSFFYSGSGQLCVGNTRNTGPGCTTLVDQATTGACPAGAKYWEIGVLGDGSPVPPGGNSPYRLNPTGGNAVMSSNVGYLGIGTSLTNGQRNRLAQYCNGSRIVPEVPSVLNPPSIKNLQVAATVDEGNNYVNLRFGPLYVEKPTNKTLFGPLSP
jgi:hypothetical protein